MTIELAGEPLTLSIDPGQPSLCLDARERFAEPLRLLGDLVRTGRNRACARALQHGHAGEKANVLSQNADHGSEAGGSAVRPQNQLSAAALAEALNDQVLALATGKTQQEITAACKGVRPNHVGAAIARHKRAGCVEERDGKLYATQPSGTEQRVAV